MTTSPVMSITDELVAEIELGVGHDYCSIPGGVIGALLAEREQLKRDAERYRWLRDDRAYFPEEEGMRGGQELDAAIDAAMQS